MTKYETMQNYRYSNSASAACQLLPMLRYKRIIPFIDMYYFNHQQDKVYNQKCKRKRELVDTQYRH